MKEFVVIGLGRFGSSVARSLMKNGNEVLAIDKKEERINKLRDELTHVVEADAADGDVLESLGVGNFDVGIVSIGDDVHANILTTLILKEHGVSQVLSRAVNEMHGKILTRVGADEVVFPERDMGERIAEHLLSENMLDYIEVSPDHSIIEITAPEFMVDKTLKEINLRSDYDINLMVIKRGDELNLTPGGNNKIREGDVLVLLGENKQLESIK
ncbi:potassium channel family protein [Halarsenatibacter silvermanii]|uniref:Trk system potassium uptake protein TrkA n=1 Tax=Halarsenatibacter silvermanii TaxID=321763 RepID=A0A1G9KXR2_9FIRM|nr:TrkA family potassium uptake protein [Halarsenatibacter silvermanii]SDL54135.1 trk system potassium uptake protein TrkA [Halarsenatibacter silvermanii]